MTSNEINAFARITNLSAACAGKKVLIKREDGKYLTRTRLTGPMEWTATRALAYVYDYDADRVADQLQQVELTYGAQWTAEIFDPKAK